MRWAIWRHWTIMARLVMIAVVPASLMFVAVTTALYLSGMGEVRRDVAERGQLIATALAQGSQYGVVSGNTAYLKSTVDGLIAADRSISLIRISDAQHRQLVEVGDPHAILSGDCCEAPINIAQLNVDIYGATGGARGHPDGTSGNQPKRTKTAGYVRVVMSAKPLLAARRQHVIFAGVCVLASALFSAWVGLVMSKKLRTPLVAVMGALRSIRQGNYEVHFEIQTGEVGELQRAITEMSAGLSVKQSALEEQVAGRTAELKLAMAQVVEADAEKRRLIAHGNALVEEDRRKIAVEIHDHLNATLITLRLQATALAAQAKAGIHDPAEIDQIAAALSEATESLYVSARNIVKQLRPELIDTLGLAGALDEMVRHFNTLDASCRFTFRADETFPILKGEAAMPIYRVAQEALANVVKHARATNCWVVLESVLPERRIRVIVGDNGQGFDTHARATFGLGLVGMRERACAAGGDLTIDSELGQGTRVCLSVVLSAGAIQAAGST